MGSEMEFVPIIRGQETPRDIDAIGMIYANHEGGVPVGGRVRKSLHEEGDGTPLDTEGTVVSCIDTDGFDLSSIGGAPSRFCYFVLWDDFPHPVFVSGHKIEATAKD